MKQSNLNLNHNTSCIQLSKWITTDPISYLFYILRHIYVKHTNIRHSGSRTDTISEIVSDILASSELVREIMSKDVSIIFFPHKLVY